MAATKSVLQKNVRELLHRQAPLRPHESGVTRLVKLGLSQGTAQRFWDDHADVYLSTVEHLAEKFAVDVPALLSDKPAADVPYRDLDPYEAQLITFFRQLPSDAERREVLAALNQRARVPGEATPSWVGSERRIEDVPYIPDRRASRNSRK